MGFTALMVASPHLKFFSKLKFLSLNFIIAKGYLSLIKILPTSNSFDFIIRSSFSPPPVVAPDPDAMQVDNVNEQTRGRGGKGKDKGKDKGKGKGKKGKGKGGKGKSKGDKGGKGKGGGKRY